MIEQWVTAPGFPDYEVSDLGGVRRSTIDRCNRAPRAITPVGPKYLFVGLYRDGVRSTVYVNRLVCAAFHGPPPSPDHEAAHGDGDHRNNAATNLRWATVEENTADRFLHGTVRFGSTHGRAKLNEEIVKAARASGETHTALAIRHGVTSATIHKARAGHTWSHVK